MLLLTNLIIAIAAAEQIVLAGKKQPFTFKDMYGLAQIGDIAVSDKIAYVESKFNVSSKLTKRRLMIIDAGKVTEISGGCAYSDLMWLSTTELAFQQTCQGQSSLVSFDVTRFEPHVIANTSGIENVRYNAATDSFVFTKRVALGEIEDNEDYKIFDKMYIRHWDKWDDHKSSHVFTAKKSTIEQEVDWMAGLAHLSTPIDPFGDKNDFAVSADGSEILISSMARYNESTQAYSTHTDIFTISNGNVKTLTCLSCSQSKGAKRIPKYSPSGGYVSWLQMNAPKYEADKNNLVVLVRKTGEIKQLTQGWDYSISNYIWLSQDSLLAVVEDRGQTAIYEIRLNGSKRLIKRYGGMSIVDKLPNGDVLIKVSSMDAPHELFSISLQGEMKQLTKINDMDRFQMIKPQEFWFEGAKGDKVMGWYLKPEQKTQEKLPVLMLIHGGPESAWMNSFSYRWNPGAFAAGGYAVVMVNFHGSSGYGQAFTDSIHKNWGTYPYEDIMKGIEHILSKEAAVLDRDRVCALGASYGGYMINWINGHNPGVFKCLVNHDGLFDLKSMYYTTEELYFPEYEFGVPPYENKGIKEMYDLFSPSSYVHLWKTPTLVIHGGLDFRVPETEGIATFTALQRRGIESRLVYFPKENHWILNPSNGLIWHREIFNWIAKFI